jgi:hypothetical protein
MKRWLTAFVFLITFGVLALALLHPAEMLAPGPLHAGHESLKDDCFACHAPFRGASKERCVACHALADIGVRTTRGTPVVQTAMPPFHLHLTSTDCMACHTDHQKPMLASAGQSKFSHDLLASASRSNCSACHRPPADALHKALASQCGTCHSTADWSAVKLDHSRFFLLEGEHDVACVTCHVGGDLTSFTCFGCHAHEPSKMAREHREEGISNIENCVACHRRADDD